MDVISALKQHSEAGAAIVDLLYGDMGSEVSKALVEFGKEEQKTDAQKRIAQASNLVGIGAGAAATPGAIAAVRPAWRKAMGKPELPKSAVLRRIGGAVKATSRGRRALRLVKNPKFAAAAATGGAALQVGNLGGDFVTNRVLGRKKVEKSVEEVDILCEISKVDDDKRQVFGWASVTSVNGQPVVDLQDDVLDLEEIEKAAYAFVQKSRIGGNMHAKEETGPIHVSDMIESMVITPEKKKVMGLPDEVPEGWWVGFKVNDDTTWTDAKTGKLAGFSIHGTGRRVPV